MKSTGDRSVLTVGVEFAAKSIAQGRSSRKQVIGCFETL